MSHTQPNHTDITHLLHLIHGERRDLLNLTELPDGEQGASGSRIRYYLATSAGEHGQQHEDRIVVKDATQMERRVVQLLAGQGCAVPPSWIPDADDAERAPVYMPFTDPRPPLDLGHPQSPFTESVAAGLAGIHAANRGRPPVWLPRVDGDVLGRLWLHAGREQWQANLAQPDFAQEFGAYTDRLDLAMQRFLAVLKELAAEGSSHTLLNVDLIPDHIRVWRGAACFIDWQQSAYGSLYLDLPNHFLVETVLLYRDALDRHGCTIPVMEFLERCHAVSPYMGLRYLGYSLWRWAQGGEERRQGRWFLYYTLHLALHGR